eukprot:10809-Rhodomonas_salina.1
MALSLCALPPAFSVIITTNIIWHRRRHRRRRRRRRHAFRVPIGAEETRSRMAFPPRTDGTRRLFDPSEYKVPPLPRAAA